MPPPAPPPEVLVVGRGYTAEFRVQLRDYRGRAYTGRFVGDEELTLVVCDGDGAALELDGSGIEWRATLDDGTTLDAAEAADAGLCTLKVDDSDTTTLTPGRYPLSVAVDTDGEPVEAYRAVLAIEARPLPDAP